jgi:Tfp pilus assembly protein PilP
MTLKIGILAVTAMLGTVWAQNADVVQNTSNTLQNVQKNQAIQQNAALAAGQNAAPTSVPAASKPVTSGAAATAKSKRQTKTVVAVNKPAQPKQAVAVEDKKAPEESKKKEPREYSAAGRRDPFISPVVSHTTGGSGCSSGKRCLAVDQIILTGIVKSDTGMIAVVINSMNKAYFLRENDPVFNGYVVKITVDSIIFSETLEDKLGKPFTREVTKKISTPAV